MRATLSIVLAGLLVTTPLKQVLAQAAQQDSTTADTSLVREQRSQPIIRVPALTPEATLLWVQDSVPRLPSSLQNRAWRSVALTVPRADSGTVLLTGSGLSYPGTALDANTRSRDASGNPMPISTGGKIAIVVVAVLVVAAVVIAVVVSNIPSN